MVVTYSTAAKVASLLRLIDPETQVRLALSENTDPTLLEVEALINEAEDQIDEQTHHAWRAVTVTNEYHDLEALYSGMYRYELPVKLNHRSIRALVSGTDKIEIWDGTNWKDLVLTANGYIEERSKDWWCDYTNGIIYFCNTKPCYSNKGVRVTYRYGEATVSKDIQKVCSLISALKILESEDYKIVLPENSNQYAIASKAETWRKEIENILGHYQEIPAAVL